MTSTTETRTFDLVNDVTAEGALFDDSRALSGLIGRPTTPLADVVRAAL